MDTAIYEIGKIAKGFYESLKDSRKYIFVAGTAVIQCFCKY